MKKQFQYRYSHGIGKTQKDNWLDSLGFLGLNLFWHVFFNRHENGFKFPIKPNMHRTAPYSIVITVERRVFGI